jgi:hypothetical protein
MKLAVIADIHGNCTALEAVLADIAALGISDAIGENQWPAGLGRCARHRLG